MELRKMLFIAIHVILGLGCYYIPGLSTIWIYFYIFYSLDRIIRYKNSDEWAAISAGYLVGLEVLLRMSHSGLFYEGIKYSVAIVLILGMVVERYNRKIPIPLILYFIFLLPSVLMIDADLNRAREFISFNLSGPLSLCLSTVYFFKRKLDIMLVRQLFFNIILPLFAMVVFIVLKMPSLSKVGFTLASTKLTSGGFGPNQVSTILGFGFLLVGIVWVLKVNITGNVLVDRMAGVLFIAFAVFSFSRGGVLVAVFVLFIAFIIIAKESRNLKSFFRIVGIIIFICGSGYYLWNYLNKLTGSALEGRYQKTYKQTTDIRQLNTEEYSNEEVQLNVSGRDKIFFADLDIFMRHPILGVGPGMGNKFRVKYIGFEINAHTEFSRMLAEHGIYGLVSLLIMVCYPFTYYRHQQTVEGKVFIICFVLFSLLTTTHAAMRLALPGFSYGMAFILVVKGINPLAKLRFTDKLKKDRLNFA
jgi:hypothetical protein